MSGGKKKRKKKKRDETAALPTERAKEQTMQITTKWKQKMGAYFGTCVPAFLGGEDLAKNCENATDEDKGKQFASR